MKWCACSAVCTDPELKSTNDLLRHVVPKRLFFGLFRLKILDRRPGLYYHKD
jgi:hypothetical protein